MPAPLQVTPLTIAQLQQGAGAAEAASAVAASLPSSHARTTWSHFALSTQPLTPGAVRLPLVLLLLLPPPFAGGAAGLRA